MRTSCSGLSFRHLHPPAPPEATPPLVLATPTHPPAPLLLPGMLHPVRSDLQLFFGCSNQNEGAHSNTTWVLSLQKALEKQMLKEKIQ